DIPQLTRSRPPESGMPFGVLLRREYGYNETMRPPFRCFLVSVGSLACAAALAFVPRFASAADEAPAAPLLQWQFDGADEPGEWKGNAKPAAGEAGPRSPRYPGF